MHATLHRGRSFSGSGSATARAGACRPCVRASGRRGTARGSLLIETGLALAAMVLLTAGALDFARGLAALHTISYASTEAARYAAVRGARSASPATAESIEAFVKRHLPGVNQAAVSVSASWQPDNHPGSVVEVRVQYAFRSVVPAFSAGTISMERTARMEILN
jgi:Flp pilus assembly protein TadG